MFSHKNSDKEITKQFAKLLEISNVNYQKSENKIAIFGNSKSIVKVKKNLMKILIIKQKMMNK